MIQEEKALEEQKNYRHGFVTPITSHHLLGRGLSEEIVRKISQQRKEPEFLLNFRLQSYKKWLSMQEPHWANIQYDPIDYQKMAYFSTPQKKAVLESLDQVDPEILETFNKLGIPLDEQKRLANVAVDAVFDSVSITTTFKETLKKSGVIFCSLTEAVQLYPELVEKYLGSVVPIGDNFFSTLNSAVFSDGSFVYVPKGVRCPMELSTYFRINDREAGQFERTLIIVEEEGSASYLEGCTAPSFSSHQLHAAVVELVVLDRGVLKYSTVQNWYPGDMETGKGGILNFVTKRGRCLGKESKISWVQVEVGAAVTWKYPSCILQGDDSIGEFYSIALTNGQMQADTGTKMIHLGKNTTSKIISKGISADRSTNNYRGLVTMTSRARGARNYTQCDSMLVGNRCSAHTFPVIDVCHNYSVCLEHEATVSRMDASRLHYLRTRGFSLEEAIELVIEGFCGKVMSQLPLEFAAEADKLLAMKLSRSVG